MASYIAEGIPTFVITFEIRKKTCFRSAWYLYLLDSAMRQKEIIFLDLTNVSGTCQKGAWPVCAGHSLL